MTECGLKNYYYKKRCDEGHTFFFVEILDDYLFASVKAAICFATPLSSEV